MLARRIIPCLDVKDAKVVKGINFTNHQVVGDIVELAEYYSMQGADELVFYDITASSYGYRVSPDWVEKVALKINIPFCVAGGIDSLEYATKILRCGADKISINTPAIKNPDLITQIADSFGSQCVVVGVDSKTSHDGNYCVWHSTGSEKTAGNSFLDTFQWIKTVTDLGAGEIVLNCMNSDGVRKGYDIKQLKMARDSTTIPLIASGGAGSYSDFYDLFKNVAVDGALAASVFHSKQCNISILKQKLLDHGINIRTV